MHDYRYIHHVHVLDLFLHHHRLTISKQSWPCSIHFTLLSISAYTKGFFTSERPSTSTIIEFQFLSIHFLPSLSSKPVSPWNLISCWVITIFSDLSLYAPKIKGLEINLSCVYHKKSNMMLSCLSLYTNFFRQESSPQFVYSFSNFQHSQSTWTPLYSLLSSWFFFTTLIIGWHKVLELLSRSGDISGEHE